MARSARANLPKATHLQREIKRMVLKTNLDKKKMKEHKKRG